MSWPRVATWAITERPSALTLTTGQLLARLAGAVQAEGDQSGGAHVERRTTRIGKAS